MRTILAVDAGGIKTRAVLLDERKNVLSVAIAGAGNPTLDYDGAVENITKVATDVMKEGETPCAMILGASGASAVAEKLIADLSEKMNLPVFITTDSVLSVFAALGARNGLVVISGTGSIVQGKKDGVMHRNGGWGHLLGEFGSGASIGYSTLSKIAEAIDAGEELTELQEPVFAKLGVQDRWEMTNFVYNHTKGDVAVLASVVNKLAIGGEPHAQTILTEEARKLAEHTAALYNKLGFTDEEIFMTGGCITHCPWFRNQYIAFVKELLPMATLSQEPIFAENGAWAYWYWACAQEAK